LSAAEPRPAAAHRWFAGGYAALAWLGERSEVGRRRERLLDGARGRLLVIGLGPGYDLDHVPAGVRAVTALEPDRYMRARSRRAVDRLRARGVAVQIVAGRAEHLPVADRSVDAVLCAFVLCSVADPVAALAEAGRVLRPGGRLLLLEHVRGADGSRTARAQDRLDRWWPRLAGGCHLNRDTPALVWAAGFDDSGLRVEEVRPAVPLLARMLEGAASRERVVGENGWP
jgi:SAM-dependent methyltransferase